MDDQLKQRAMTAILVFNMTVIIYMIVMFFVGPGISWGVFGMRLLTGGGIGLVLAICAYFGVQMSQR